MRGSTTVATRLTLLALVTGLFAAAWAGDEPGKAVAAVACRTYPRNDSTQLAQTRRRRIETEKRVTARPTGRGRWAWDHSRTSNSQHGTSNIASLPPGIAPGQYRIVDSTGEVTTVRVPGERDGAASARDLYILDTADGKRQYFIRIKQRADTVLRTESTAGAPSPARR